MKLSELISGLSEIEVVKFSECEITSVTDDSKASKSDSVFIAKKGANYNGADFIEDARERGTRVFVCECEISARTNETVIMSKNPRKTMAEISKLLFGNNLTKMTIIGITGTKGKTTTLKILTDCLASQGHSFVSISTLGAHISAGINKFIHTDNTTPKAPFIYETLRNAYNCGVRFAVIEVSSQALANYRVYGIPFSVCIFTNFSCDHIGIHEHNDCNEYFEAKRLLFSAYNPQICIVNSDDPSWSKMTKGRTRVIKVGKTDSDYLYKPVFSSDEKSEFYVSGNKFYLSLGGEYNSKNAALALACASVLLGKDVASFGSCLTSIKVPGRYETYILNGVKIVIDFAHNGKSFEAICTSVAKNCEGRIILLFGSVGGRCYSRRRELAAAAERFADFSVITSDNPGNEPAERIANEIYSYFADKSKAKIVTDRERAIYFALSIASKKDIVLLLGKGQENYQLIGNTKVPFSEREILKKLGAG